MVTIKKPLSGNTLKLIAAVAMLFDHIGVIFFPGVAFFKAVGRLAFPLFAYFIAEGCKYTKRRAKHLLTVAIMAIVFQIVYFLALRSLYMSIFVTFSLSISLIYLLDWFKESLYAPSATLWQSGTRLLLFLLVLFAVYTLNRIFSMDYGFIGCITPLFASLCHAPKNAPAGYRKIDTPWISALSLFPPLVFLALRNPLLQVFGFVTLPLLFFYSGKRGKYNMKYFFYIFYPTHLVILYGIFFFLS